MKKLFVLFTVVAIIAAVAYSQVAVTVTQVPQTQLTGEVTATGSIWITLPDGTPRQALIEASAWDLILPAPGSGAPPILRPKATSTLPPDPIVQRLGVRVNPSGNLEGREYQLAETFVDGTLIIFRNGLRQAEGIDFAFIDNRTVVFVNHYANDADALVLVDYRHDPEA